MQGDSKEEFQVSVHETVNLFHSLGLVSHPEKSVFEPTQILIILGFEINLINMTVKLTVEKVTQLVDACQMLIQSTTTSIRSVAQIIGYMVASFPVAMFGPLYYRTIEKEQSLALKQHNGEYEAGVAMVG